MESYKITDVSQMQKGYRTIMEPNTTEDSFVPKDKIQVLIVPGFVYTYDGYRIGFGGGYYDQFLVDFEHESIALCSEKQIVTYIGHEARSEERRVGIECRRLVTS